VGFGGGGGAVFNDSGTKGWGVDPHDNSFVLVAFPQFRRAETCASLIVFGENSAVTYQVFNVDSTTGSPSLLGSGTMNTLLDISDYVQSTNSKYLVIKVFVTDLDNDTVYGGVLYKNDAGTLELDFGLTPKDFLRNKNN
jgi:hypothetical protein